MRLKIWAVRIGQVKPKRNDVSMHSLAHGHCLEASLPPSDRIEEKIRNTDKRKNWLFVSQANGRYAEFCGTTSKIVVEKQAKGQAQSDFNVQTDHTNAEI